MNKSLDKSISEHFIHNGNLVEEGTAVEIKMDSECNCSSHCYTFECPDNLADKSNDVNCYIWQPEVVSIDDENVGPEENDSGESCLLIETNNNSDFNKFSPLATLGLPDNDKESIMLSKCGWTITLWAKINETGTLPDPLQNIQLRWLLLMKGVWDKNLGQKCDELNLKLLADFNGPVIVWNVCVNIGNEEFIFKLDNFDPLIKHNYVLVYLDNLEVYLDGVLVSKEDNFVSGTLDFDGFLATKYVEKHGTISLGWQSPEQLSFFQLDQNSYKPWDGCIDNIYIFDKPLEPESVQNMYNHNKIYLLKDTYCWSVPEECLYAMVKTVTITVCILVCGDVCDISGCETIRIFKKNSSGEETILEMCDINKTPGDLFIENLEDEFQHLVKICIDFENLYCNSLKLQQGDMLCVDIYNGCYIVETFPTIVTGCTF